MAVKELIISERTSKLRLSKASMARIAVFVLCSFGWSSDCESGAAKILSFADWMTFGQPAKKDPCNWTLDHIQPTRPAIAARGDLPLSDQQNQGKWAVDPSRSDEFNGPALDLSRWQPGVEGWMGRPPALFVPENVSEAGGMLDLTMSHVKVPAKYTRAGFADYATAAAQSRKPVLYGYFEIRAKIMPTAGSSAFWLASETAQNWNEIDVFELAGKAPGDPHKAFMNAHVFRTNGRTVDRLLPGVMATSQNMADDFHVYGLDWNASSIDIYVDGRHVRHICNTSWHMPLKIILDAETQQKWWGLPSFKDLPSTFQVDYIRVWRHEVPSHNAVHQGFSSSLDARPNSTPLGR